MRDDTLSMLGAVDYWVRILLAIEDHEEGHFTREEVIRELRGCIRAIDLSLEAHA